VATKVIRRAKADTITDLRRLVPFLRALADSGDSLTGALRSLLAFPFSDELVKDNVAQALAPCPSPPVTQAVVRNGVCEGDYWNLDIHLKLDNAQAINLIRGLLSLGGLQDVSLFGPPPGGASAGSASAASASQPAAAATNSPAGGVADAVKNVTGAVSPGPAAATATPSTKPTSSGGLCGLLHLCRAPAASLYTAQQSDLGRILVKPVVAE